MQGQTRPGCLVFGSAGERRIRQTFRPEQRLRRKSDFQALRDRGISRAHPLLVLRAVPNGLPYARFAFVVSKRVSTKAVVRNRVRRRLKEIVRRSPIRRGWDQMLIARQPSATADFQSLRTATLELERKLDLLDTEQKRDAEE